MSYNLTILDNNITYFVVFQDGRDFLWLTQVLGHVCWRVDPLKSFTVYRVELY